MRVLWLVIGVVLIVLMIPILRIIAFALGLGIEALPISEASKQYALGVMKRGAWGLTAALAMFLAGVLLAAGTVLRRER